MIKRARLVVSMALAAALSGCASGGLLSSSYDGPGGVYNDAVVIHKFPKYFVIGDDEDYSEADARCAFYEAARRSEPKDFQFAGKVSQADLPGVSVPEHGAYVFVAPTHASITVTDSGVPPIEPFEILEAGCGA